MENLAGIPEPENSYFKQR